MAPKTVPIGMQRTMRPVMASVPMMTGVKQVKSEPGIQSHLCAKARAVVTGGSQLINGPQECVERASDTFGSQGQGLSQPATQGRDWLDMSYPQCAYGDKPRGRNCCFLKTSCTIPSSVPAMACVLGTPEPRTLVLVPSQEQSGIEDFRASF